MRKFLLYIMGVISMLSFQSCLHDDKELFDESAAERLEHATEETKQILESSTSGWAFQYYLGDEYTSGGCTYLVKFKDGKADVALDLADAPTDIAHSSYDVVKDQGLFLHLIPIMNGCIILLIQIRMVLPKEETSSFLS